MHLRGNYPVQLPENSVTSWPDAGGGRRDRQENRAGCDEGGRSFPDAGNGSKIAGGVTSLSNTINHRL